MPESESKTSQSSTYYYRDTVYKKKL